MPQPRAVPHPAAAAHPADLQPLAAAPGPAGVTPPRFGPEPYAIPERSPGRVRLLSVNFADDGTVVEVNLGRSGNRSVGRAPAGRPAGVVVATLQALEELGWSIPFTVRNAVRLAMGIDGAIAVSLSGPGGDRLGISRGSTAEEAAAKATLHALNRYLGDTRLPPD